MIGAGISGLAAARSLSRREIPFECFDRAHRVGGAYALPGRGRSEVSREQLQFSDWPMPRSSPLFPGGSRVASYLRDYAERFRLGDHIRLETGVAAASRAADGKWEIELDGGERRRFDALVVAGGSDEIASTPRALPPGEFSGTQVHVSECRDESVMRARDVVVAGGGGAACDAAVASSYVARSTHISLLRPHYVLPQVVLGRPYDQLPGLPYLLGRGGLPRGPRRRMLEAGHRALVSLPLHGLPRPSDPPGEAEVTVAPSLLERLLHGRIHVRPAIARLEGDHVRFADGSRAKANLIVWCTESRTGFPFLPDELAPAGEGRLELFWNVFPVGEPGLAFVGLVNPLGSPTRIAECQGEWVAAYLSRRYALPNERAMRRSIERRRGGRGHHSSSPGRAPAVEQHHYLRHVNRERRMGRWRVRLWRR
ncbi:MAG TPA: NAD(P)-binding domain-containing protein [Solirubrobacterales bacterium]|nr:NAD(P)-binding domain-containing protein [Solirubrobacterales bacterium]